MGNNGVDVLAVRVDKVEQEVSELKNDIKEEFKEMRDNIKKNEDFYTQNLIFLRENLAVLSAIAKSHEEDIKNLKQSNKPSSDDEDKKWYRQMLTENHKWLWYVLILVIGTLCGANWDAITSFLHK